MHPIHKHSNLATNQRACSSYFIDRLSKSRFSPQTQSFLQLLQKSLINCNVSSQTDTIYYNACILSSTHYSFFNSPELTYLDEYYGINTHGLFFMLEQVNMTADMYQFQIDLTGSNISKKKCSYTKRNIKNQLFCQL